MLRLYVLIQSSLFIELINLGTIISKSCLFTGEMKKPVLSEGCCLQWEGWGSPTGTELRKWGTAREGPRGLRELGLLSHPWEVH